MPITAPKSEVRKIPKLRFPGFSGDWEEKKLGDFLLPQLRVVDKPTGLYKAIGIRSHFKGTFQKPDSDPDKIAMEELFVVHENDFIVNITFAWEGALAIAKKEDAGGLVSHRFPTYLFKDEVTDSKYFSYVFPTKTMKYKLDLISPGGAGRNRVLNKKDLLKIKINLPSLPEQQKIADFLSSTDQWIETLRSQKETLESYKAETLRKIFNQGIRFKDDEGKEFPEWEEKKLNSLGRFISGQGFSDNEQGGKAGIPFYKVSDMNLPGNEKIMNSANHYVTDEQIKRLKYKVNEEKSIIFAKVGAAIFLERKRLAEKFLLDNNMMAFIPSINVEFIQHLFATIRLSQYAQVGALPSYNSTDLGIIKTSIPRSKLEQQKIADFLTSIDKLIEAKQKQITLAERWKKGLMQNLFV